jgi:hypothetical protein
MRAAPLAFALAALMVTACGSVTTTGDGAGQGGTAGRGSGGTGGGTGGTTAGSCSDLQTQYAAALTAAKSCSQTTSNQCQQKAPASLGCGCETFVNSRTALDQLESSWNQAGCQNSVVCPAIACVPPRSSFCRAGDGGGASCSDVLVTP